MTKVHTYTPEHASAWDAFVRGARNGHFFFERRYVEYHSDRFEDHSFVVTHRGHFQALMPANRVADTVFSHQGLTFGGILVDNLGGVEIIRVLEMICKSLRGEG